MSKTYTDTVVGEVLLRKSIRSRQISLKIQPRKGIILTVPFFVPYSAGIRFLHSKRQWVLATLKKQEEKQHLAAPVLNISDGTCINTLLSSIQFRENKENSTIQILSSANILPPEHFLLNIQSPANNTIVTYPKGSTEDQLKNILIELLRKEAKQLLPHKISYIAKMYGFTYNRITIKHNKSNWGSCSAKNNINLNLNIILLPEYLCDYVLLHELCHLQHHNHGELFHRLLEKCCTEQLKKYADNNPAAIRHLQQLIAVSKAKFPALHTLEQEIKKHRLI